MNTFIESFLDRLLATSVQTALLTAVVWTLCRYVPRLSPSTQSWLWWLVALQALIGLFVAPIQLPWLPPAPAVIPEVMPATQWSKPLSDSVATTYSNAAYSRPLWQPAIFLFWVSGLAVMSWSTLRHWRRARQLLKASLPCTDEHLLQTLARTSAACGLRTVPRMHVSHHVDSPLLIGHMHPVVLLPADVSLSSDELDMVFAHELTHLRRGDLWWGCVPSLARHLFFFHPLAHLAVGEYGIAREAACDAAAVGTDNRSRENYGRLLVQLGTSAGSSAGIAVASPTFRTLQRRLTMLQNTSFLPRIGSIAVLIAVAVVGVMPLRLVAAAETPAAVVPAPAVNTPPRPDTSSTSPTAPAKPPAAATPPKATRPARPGYSETVTPNWNNVDIMVVAEAVGKVVGKTFVATSQVRGNVTFTSTRALSAQELYNAFLNILPRYGFAAIDAGNNIVKIVKEGVASPALNNSPETTNPTAAEATDNAVQADRRRALAERLASIEKLFAGLEQSRQTEPAAPTSQNAPADYAMQVAMLEQLREQLTRRKTNDTANADPDLQQRYIIGPGDRLQVFVWRYPELTIEVPVPANGTISTPMVENMMASGKTPSQLARDIEAELAKSVRAPRVSVLVAMPAPRQ